MASHDSRRRRLSFKSGSIKSEPPTLQGETPSCRDDAEALPGTFTDTRERRCCPVLMRTSLQLFAKTKQMLGDRAKGSRHSAKERRHALFGTAAPPIDISLH